MVTSAFIWCLDEKHAHRYGQQLIIAGPTGRCEIPFWLKHTGICGILCWLKRTGICEILCWLKRTGRFEIPFWRKHTGRCGISWRREILYWLKHTRICGIPWRREILYWQKQHNQVSINLTWFILINLFTIRISEFSPLAFSLSYPLLLADYLCLFLKIYGTTLLFSVR